MLALPPFESMRASLKLVQTSVRWASFERTCWRARVSVGLFISVEDTPIHRLKVFGKISPSSLTCRIIDPNYTVLLVPIIGKGRV